MDMILCPFFMGDNFKTKEPMIKGLLQCSSNALICILAQWLVEIMENLSFLANASNLVTYLDGFMNFQPAKAATTVTNFMGTAFLLALLGGFLSDAFFTTYIIYLISAAIEFLHCRPYAALISVSLALSSSGLMILTIQARSTSLMPPHCDAGAGASCQEAAGGRAAMLFAGLYLTALGVGGIKGSLPSHGAEQLDHTTAAGRRQRSTFFNYFVFSLSTGGLIAVTFVVWVEDNKGWQWGFAISTITILLSIPVFLSGSALYRNKIPAGSPLTTIAKVLAAAALSSSAAVADLAPSPDVQRSESDKPNSGGPQASKHMKFLNRAAAGSPAHRALSCSVEVVEEVKAVIGILPIFFSTIMLNCCLAQLSTFSVQQAATMDTRIGGLTVPPASLPVFPVIFIMVLAPLYDHLVIPFARRLTGTETGITHLQRIGAGLLLSVVAMATAALVEVKRKKVAVDSGMADGEGPLPITFFWVALQYLFLGSADLFTLAGLLEFFFTETPAGMRSLATSLSWASLAMGYYLSSVLVAVVNRITGRGGRRPWLAGRNLNQYRLERFYWLMCALSAVNFGHYLFCAVRYKYKAKQGRWRERQGNAES
ncbi:Nitrate transporter 1.2 [Apostasia shenzhenica]|uniref:Nitrate transporter 1.2 n=1 Tax=Apostasia shenzhenica TaxID=1088818 RepID=A0A2I0B791_9ASPA|nr:Nitrate transporter 1.2 [Apostasia shenzhenica]